MGVLMWMKIRRTIFLCKDREGFDCLEKKLVIYPYHVLKAATRNFDPTFKLGQGGFGTVFMGLLPDGTKVAVKKLSQKSFQGNHEFFSEIALISHAQHQNLVLLKGWCTKQKERLLVYEFLENRSLFQALLDRRTAIHLDWPTRMKIIIGVARGLAYLHEGSPQRIIHRDIKASNILLDKNLNAKIGDFGLAKLFPDDQTHLSTRIAGTIGYVAPEYAMRGHLTVKADIFSFGILALEVVSGKSNMDPSLPNSTLYILDWAFELLNEGKLLELVDPKLEDNYCLQEALRIIQIALLCTQGMASARPSISLVLSMLLGQTSIEDVCTRNFEDFVNGMLPHSSSTRSLDASNPYYHFYGSSVTCQNCGAKQSSIMALY